MNAELKHLLKEKSPIPLENAQIDQLGAFFDLILAENEVQNLTRITDPSAFFWDQLYDCLVLKRTSWLERGPLLDIGPGAGIPGVVLAILGVSGIEMVETERRKAQFIAKALEELEIPARIFWGRAEKEAQRIRPTLVMAKAVGPLERIYRWMESCSTWNMMVLFKGPSWSQEWMDTPPKIQKVFQTPKIHTYSTPEKQRNLVLLTRVPRGTE